MKRKFTAITLSLVLMMFTVLMAACGGNSSNQSEQSSQQQNEQSSQQSSNTSSNNSSGSSGKVTVQFWHSLGGKNGEYLDKVLKAFNESQDKIEVVGTYQGSYAEAVTKLQQAVAANTAPDIAMLERAYVQMFAEADALEDLTPYFDKTPDLKVDDFVPGLMGHSKFNNKLVALPFNRSTPIMHVNKTLLDQLGLQVPKTWEDLKKVANALVVKENGEYKRYGLTMPYDTWYPMAMITQAGGKFFNDEGTSVGFDSEGVKMFQFLKDLQSTGALYYPPSQDSANIVRQMFINQKVGLLFESTGVIGSIATNTKDKFEYVTAFLPADQKHANPTGGANIAIMASSKNKDAAWEFIHWAMTNPKGSLQFILDSGYLPYTKQMVESKEIQDLWAKEPNRKVAYEQLQYAIDTNKHTAWPQVEQEFFSAIQAIMYDNKDIKSTLDTFKKETERILAESK